MNLSLKKFNVATNTQRLVSNTTKQLLYLLFLFCLMLNYNTTSAQTDDCSELNPIDWNWIRSFIYYEQMHRCSVGEIRQFEFNGSICIETIPPETVTGQFCSTNYEPQYFDCNGELLCDLSDTGSVCDTELLNAANNYTTLWTYKDCGADPLEWDWIQDLIDSSDGSNVSAIYQFEYEGNSHIKTINSNNSTGDYNVYFDCEGERVCEYIYESNTNDCDNPSIHYGSNGNFTIVWSFEEPYPSGTCSESDDPLQWNWIQELLEEPDVCKRGYLNQFEYNGNPYFYFGEGTYCNIADLPRYYLNCVGETVCSLGMGGGSCDSNFRNSALNSTTIWTYEPPIAKTCPEGYPEQWDWVKTMRDSMNGCGETEIVDIVFDDYMVIHFWNECDNLKNRFYDCQGNLLCGVESDLRLGWLCYQLTNVMEGYTPAVCPEGGDPMQWDWMKDLIIEYSDCEVREIRQFEYREKTYFKTISGLDFPCDEFGLGYFDCSGKFICDDFYDENCLPDMVAASNSYETIWQYRNGISSEACPEGDPLEWDWIQDLIIEGRCDIGGIIRQFEVEGKTYFLGEPGEFDERGFYCPDDHPSRIYDCNGQFLCEFGDMVRPNDCSNTNLNPANPFTGSTAITIIWPSQSGALLDFIECPQNHTTNLCVPVAASPPLTLPDLITTDNLSYLNSMSMQMEEQTDVYKYYNTTTRVYTIADEAGNQKTCATKHHIATELLQAPLVSQSGVVCEEDLWSYVKMGTDQYKIYADNNGSKGEAMSTCNTPSLICSTADLGVDTDVPGQYNFWATTFFEFPDGNICESEPTLFYADVQPKPVAELSLQNRTVNIGEDINLMDMVTDNKNGYWSGKNITYLATITGENVAYFSTNNPGVYKLYYTVSNEFCERSYLMIVEVHGASSKPETIIGMNIQDLSSFNIYPNPTTGKVFIDLLDHSIEQINLMDITGKVMRQINKRLKTVEVNVNDLPKGMYLVEVKNETGSLVQKLIIE